MDGTQHRPHKLGNSIVYTTHAQTMDVTNLKIALKKVVGDNTDHGKREKSK